MKDITCKPVTSPFPWRVPSLYTGKSSPGSRQICSSASLVFISSAPPAPFRTSQCLLPSSAASTLTTPRVLAPDYPLLWITFLFLFQPTSSNLAVPGLIVSGPVLLVGVQIYENLSTHQLTNMLLLPDKQHLKTLQCRLLSVQKAFQGVTVVANLRITANQTEKHVSSRAPSYRVSCPFCVCGGQALRWRSGSLDLCFSYDSKKILAPKSPSVR